MSGCGPGRKGPSALKFGGFFFGPGMSEKEYSTDSADLSLKKCFGY